MSYNITQWSTLELTALRVPMSALYDISLELQSRGWRPKDPEFDLANERTAVKIKLPADDGQIEGSLLADKDTIEVSSIRLSGAGSGVFLQEVLEPALAKGSGTLKARLVWESGDSFSQLIATGGNVSNTDEG